MKPDIINWNEIWKKERAGTQLTCTEQEARWNTTAPLFRDWMDSDDYPQKLLDRARMNPEWSVLDIGCGTGAISIPAALRSRTVTALDISQKMLEILKNDADTRQIRNITVLHARWEDVRIGSDISPHDIVIMSRAIAMTEDLEEALRKIDRAALRYAYVTAWGGSRRSINQGIMQALGREYHDTADYLYIINILHMLGIRPNMEQISCRSRTLYPSLDAAVRNYSVNLRLSPEDQESVRSYLEENLIRTDDGKFMVPDNNPVWSLIWWEKSNTGVN